MENTVKNGQYELFTIIYPNKDKETIILLHRGPGFPSDMEEVTNMLKNNYQVITFHQKGTRKSPCLVKTTVWRRI